MAKRKKPSRAEEIQALVKIQRRGPAFGAGLAVNPGFTRPNEVDRERGVDPDDPEREQAEHAVAARALRELWPAGSIRMWIFRQQRRYGRQRLEEELMAMKPLPSGQDARHYRLALRRALERSGPAKKPTRKEEHRTIVNPDYRERILLLILRRSQVAIGIYGRWLRVREGEELEPFYEWYYTQPDDPSDLQAAREIIAAGGVGMVAMMEELYAKASRGYGLLKLEWLHALQVQIDAGEAA